MKKEKQLYGQQGLDKFISLCLKHNLTNILDVGAGEKQLHAKYMRERGLQVETVDFFPDSTHVGDYNKIKFENQFDGVWCSAILEHQLNVNQFLVKVFNDVKENGIVCITVPPLKHMIVGGHVNLWNAGLLLYNMVLAGFDCSQAMVKTYGYNISVLVRKKSFKMPTLTYRGPDIREILKPYFPMEYENCFDGRIEELNWKIDRRIVDNVSIIVKTFLRPAKLDACIQSIKKFYPDIHILVADDSDKPKPRNDVEYHVLPFDTGAASGRNYIVNKVQTKYFLTIDDDLLFTQHTNVDFLFDTIDNNDIDLLAFAVAGPEPVCATFSRKGKVLRATSVSTKEKKDFYYCDFAPQIFIANTEKFKAFGGWDDELKTAGEHIELFLRAQGHLKVALAPHVTVSQQDRVKDVDPKYFKYRLKRSFLDIAMGKHGVHKFINFNGKVRWERGKEKRQK